MITDVADVSDIVSSLNYQNNSHVYESNPCAQCGGTTYYLKVRRCVTCRIMATAKYKRKLEEIRSPRLDDFDEKMRGVRYDDQT